MPKTAKHWDSKRYTIYRSQFMKTQLCRYFAAGACRKGESCNFAHGKVELSHAPDLKKTALCEDFKKGKCALSADNCPYAHGQEDLRSSPAFKDTRKGNSSKGDAAKGSEAVRPPGIQNKAPSLPLSQALGSQDEDWAHAPKNSIPIPAKLTRSRTDSESTHSGGSGQSGQSKGSLHSLRDQRQELRQRPEENQAELNQAMLQKLIEMQRTVAYQIQERQLKESQMQQLIQQQRVMQEPSMRLQQLVSTHQCLQQALQEQQGRRTDLPELFLKCQQLQQLQELRQVADTTRSLNAEEARRAPCGVLPSAYAHLSLRDLPAPCSAPTLAALAQIPPVQEVMPMSSTQHPILREGLASVGEPLRVPLPRYDQDEWVVHSM
eukprot:TRINITY_DN38047_c0_g1_i1.p1 TRINITY_DN38047_c0_g1~~TRINITY_DN38047_c0_g1_i1.p1  ORF type:complete len:378 (+),score=79.22 TRINITY_DN38047_c0_g1_i1:110-1243(+)